MSRLAILAGLLLAVGCSSQSAAPPPTVSARGSSPDDHDHDHDKGSKMLVDAGPYHAGLSAHFAKDGNELDLNFETANKEAKSVALAIKSITATAKRTGDSKEYTLQFEPAPPEERKGDEEGKVSRFVAKAPWMTENDVLTVTAEVTIRAKLNVLEWKDFSPKKFAHKE